MCGQSVVKAIIVSAVFVDAADVIQFSHAIKKFVHC